MKDKTPKSAKKKKKAKSPVNRNIKPEIVPDNETIEQGIVINSNFSHPSKHYRLETKLQALAMYSHGSYSLREIAKILNVDSHTTVRLWVNDPELLSDPSIIGDVNRLKSSLKAKSYLAANRVLSKISDYDIENATLQQKSMSYGILLDKSRLLDGESTENIANIHSYQESLTEGHSKLMARLEVIDKQIEGIDLDSDKPSTKCD